MMITHLHPLWIFLTLAIPIAQMPAPGQTLPASQPGPVGLSAKGVLSPHNYADGSFGFALPYPDGSDIAREKRFISPNELEIVRFINLSHNWSLAVRLDTQDRPSDPADMLANITARLAKEFADLKVLQSEDATFASREGARFACTFKDNDDWLQQEAMIRKSTREYYRVILITPLADRPAATTAFDRIVDGFKILRSELEQKRIDDALLAGIAIKTETAKDPGRLRSLGNQDVFLRYLENGKELGFRHTYQTPGERNGQPGILIQEWAWLFRDDNSITQLQQAMFISNDLAEAEWDNRARVFMPSDKGKPASFFGIEMGILKEGMLLVHYTPTFNAPELKEKSIAAEPSFGPPAWFAILPQILDLKKPELYAFSAYDSDRRGFILRTYEVSGQTRVSVDGKLLGAIRIRDCEGLLPPFNEIDVDATGKLIRAKAGPVELLATTQQYVEKTWKSRVDEAIKTLAQYPVTPPAPPTKKESAPTPEPFEPQ